MVFRLALFAILVIAAFLALYFLTRKKWDWNSYAGALALVFTLLLVVPVGMFAWVTYENRLRVIDSMAEITLGTNSDEVKFLKGEPSLEIEYNDQAKLWRYQQEYNPENQIDIKFNAGVVSEISFSGPCEYCEMIQGFGTGSSYAEILKRFGEPDSTDISDDGLTHRLNYPEYQVFYVLEKGKVIRQGIYQP